MSRERLGAAQEYEAARDRIIHALREHTLPDSTEPVVDWVCRREDLYEGKHLEKYPDVVFNLREGYGTGWAVNAPLLTKSASHKFHPGRHRGETPVFFLLNVAGSGGMRRDVELMDVAPTVLDIMGIDWTELAFDGRSILADG